MSLNCDSIEWPRRKCQLFCSSRVPGEAALDRLTVVAVALVVLVPGVDGQLVQAPAGVVDQLVVAVPAHEAGRETLAHLFQDLVDVLDSLDVAMATDYTPISFE